MIIKRVNAEQRTAKALNDLITYLTTEIRANRVQEVGYQNIALERPELVATQMVAMAKSIGIGERPLPYRHYVLAWRREQDQPDLNSQAIVQDFCEWMHFKNVQYFFVKHGDTPHPHIHLILNRINVEKKELIVCEKELGFEIRRLQQTRKKLEEKYNLFCYPDKNRNNERKYGVDYTPALRISQAEMLKKIKERRKKQEKEQILKVLEILSENIPITEIIRKMDKLGWSYQICQETKRILLVNWRKKVFFGEEELPKHFRLVNIMKKWKEGEKVEEYRDNQENWGEKKVVKKDEEIETSL